jgi:hypothetical protein
MMLVARGWAARGGPAARYPALETLLARARCRALPAEGVDGLAAWLGKVRPGEDRSVADICRLGEPGSGPAEPGWLRADPVRLLPSGDRLRLVPPAALRVDAAHARALVRACNEHLAAEGHRLEAPHPHRWYLRPSRPLQVATFAPALVAGRDILGFMPEGPDATLVKRLMTELQMILHRDGGAGDEPGVNSVWIWGAGRPPRPAPAVLPPLWSDEPYARGIWRLTGNAVQPLPASAAHWLERAEAGGVAVLDAPASAGQAWLEALERDWCAPLLAAVAHGELAALDWVDGAETRTLTRGRLRRFWRRRRPLADGARHAD